MRKSFLLQLLIFSLFFFSSFQSAQDVTKTLAVANTFFAISNFIEKFVLVHNAITGSALEVFSILAGQVGDEKKGAHESIVELRKGFDALQKSLSNRTKELKAYIDNLNFKDKVSVHLELTSRAMNNYLKSPDRSTKEELINLCKQYPPLAVATHLKAKIFDQLTNNYKATDYDLRTFENLKTLMYRDFFEAYIIHFFQLGVIYAPAESKGAVAGAMRSFEDYFKVLDSEAGKATSEFHKKLFPHNTLETIVEKVADENEGAGNEELASAILEKLRCKYYWRHFVVIVSNANKIEFFEYNSWDGGADGVVAWGYKKKNIVVFMASENFSNNATNFKKNRKNNAIASVRRNSDQFNLEWTSAVRDDVGHTGQVAALRSDFKPAFKASDDQIMDTFEIRYEKRQIIVLFVF